MTVQQLSSLAHCPTWSTNTRRLPVRGKLPEHPETGVLVLAFTPPCHDLGTSRMADLYVMRDGLPWMEMRPRQKHCRTNCTAIEQLSAKWSRTLKGLVKGS